MAAHDAVDEEVEWVAEKDEEVEKECADLEVVLRQQLVVGRVAPDQSDQKDGQRELDEQKQSDDGHQHHRSRVALLQAARSPPVVLPQEVAPACWAALRAWMRMAFSTTSDVQGTRWMNTTRGQ